jgi:hypothetical protein
MSPLSRCWIRATAPESRNSCKKQHLLQRAASTPPSPILLIFMNPRLSPKCRQIKLTSMHLLLSSNERAKTTISEIKQNFIGHKFVRLVDALDGVSDSRERANTSKIIAFRLTLSSINRSILSLSIPHPSRATRARKGGRRKIKSTFTGHRKAPLDTHSAAPPPETANERRLFDYKSSLFKGNFAPCA